jgi:serine/threonine protein kinase/tetratricopeptide (TPR) repeat protein
MSEETLFAAVLERPPTDRPRFLEEACGADGALLGRLRILLAAHERAVGILERPAPTPGPADETAGFAPASEQVGNIVAGRYKLLEQIGEGGMGTVWVAEQTQPVRRKVALKLIKAGMDSKTVLSRFSAERQALALMDHPNIAKVLDGGATESGRPFFAMEYVKGVPFTKYCDDARLSIAERLALFVPVCQAVQHAHQKGIIHRDLKPSNILICLYDGQPVPKVIDFGLAKAIHQPLTEHTLYTAHGLMMGTPLYMSPEQAEFNNLDVDTRTDIYALGVILYELLTGTTPLEKKQFKEAAWQEMLRLIKDEEPQRPSTRLSGSAVLPSVAAQRRLEPVKLTRLVRGELDWIVMKCLEKDRGRRYETANGLARDIGRYLHDEPVEACPPSTGYRLRKFAGKHRTGLVAAGSLVTLLLLATVVCTWQAVRATRAELAALASLQETEMARAAEAEQRRLAEAAERASRAAADAEKKSKETALAREAETRAVLDFVENRVFAAARPQGQEGGLGRDVTVRRAIDAALPFLDTSFHDQPLLEARLRMTMGNSFYYLGEAKIAAEQYQAARRLYTKHRGPDHPDTLSSMNNLADTYAVLGRQADALKLREETLSLFKAKLGPDHPQTLMSMSNLADTYAVLGRQADALKLREETLSLRKAKLGPDHPQTLMSMSNLANSYSDLGRHADAIKLHEETLTLFKAKLGPDHPHTLMSMSNLANSYASLGRHADALKLREETLSLQKAKLGPDHPNTLVSMYNLANSYAAIGRDADALKLREQTLELYETKLGPTHPYTLGAMNNLAMSLATASDVKLRDLPRAFELAKRATELSPREANIWGTLGTARYRTGDSKAAIADLEKAIGLRTPEDPMNANEGFFLAMAHWRLGEKDKARDWFARSVQWMDKAFKDNVELKRFRTEAAGLLGMEKK